MTNDHIVEWTDGARSLAITFNVDEKVLRQPCHLRLCISAHASDIESRLTDRLNDLPGVVSVFFDIRGDEDIDSAHQVSRLFQNVNGELLTVIEDNGDSIARHIWYMIFGSLNYFFNEQ